MRTRWIWLVAAFCCVALGHHGLSQTGAGNAVVRDPGKEKHSAYTATFRTTTVRTLGNGTKITQESTYVEAKDSRLRTMHSSTMKQQFGEHLVVTTVDVVDPVAGVYIRWNSEKRRAIIQKILPKEQQYGCWRADISGQEQRWQASNAVHASTSSRSLPSTTESLGTRNFMGIDAEGTRRTATIPVGEIGNDQPLVRTFDRWYARALDLYVRTVNDDPEAGLHTMELVSLSLDEPDISTFQPPFGYEVVTDEWREVPCD